MQPKQEPGATSFNGRVILELMWQRIKATKKRSGEVEQREVKGKATRTKAEGEHKQFKTTNSEKQPIYFFLFLNIWETKFW